MGESELVVSIALFVFMRFLLKAKGAETLGGKEIRAYHNKSLCQNVYASIYGNLKYNFGITGTYKKLKHSQTDKALEIVRNYQPPLYLRERIDNENSGDATI